MMFAKELRRARRLLGLTQEQFANEIEGITGKPVTRQAAGKWESGETSPEREKWGAIETVLHQPKGWVVGLLEGSVTQAATATNGSVAATVSHSPNVTISAGQRAHTVDMTDAELNAIYQAAAPPLQRAVLLAYYTGRRPGSSELLALRWEAVDLMNGTIFVESAKKGGMKSRVVPIAAGLEQALREWLAADRLADALGTVVHYHGRPVGKVKTAWRAALTRAGITRRIRPYDLRHLAASAMLDAGADLKSVSEILGHASPDMTLRTYQHTSTTLRRAAVDKLGSLLPVDTKKSGESTGG